MQACVYRGAREVGGTCIEVEAHGERLVLDVGLPLADAPVAYRDLLPDVPGLWAAGDGSLRGVLVTHGHADHCGLADLIAPGVPIYAGAATMRVLDAARFFAPKTPSFKAAGHLRHGRSFELGPFRVTPWLVDHSAYDAYAILVEAGGKRLLYTGDIRCHGRKPKTLERLASHVGAVDALLVEGTRIGHQPDGRSDATEHDVEALCAGEIAQTRGLVLAFYSPQNVDRLVSVYRAARRSGRVLIMDFYTATVATATRRSVPQANWNGVRVYVTGAERRRIMRFGAYDRLAAIRSRRIFADELTASGERFVLSARSSAVGELSQLGMLHGARAIWSMWPGYLDGGSGRGIQHSLLASGVPLLHAHASGHATVDQLAGLCRAVGARRVVPVHTAAPDACAALLPRVELHGDGERWAV